MNGQDKLQTLKGVGDKIAALFHKLNIDTLDQLLRNYPRDYEQFLPVQTVASCVPGTLCSIRAILTGNPSVAHVRKLSILNFQAQDITGSIKLTFFNMPYLKSSLKKNQYYIFRGIVQSKGKQLVMEQAKIYKPEEYDKLVGSLQPKYALTSGLTNQTFTKAVKQVLTAMEPVDFLPEEMRERLSLPDLKESIADVHFPKDQYVLFASRKRLVFDEFFIFLLMIRQARKWNEEEQNENVMLQVAECDRFLTSLPYRLTGAQQKVWEEIQDDLTGPNTMNRLIQGDVGSGKTILAVLALLMTVANGYQGAFMAPTEVLATQHFETITELTKKYHLPFKPVLLIGSLPIKAKREIYAKLESGEVNLAIGTHAMIQDAVSFQSLALVITDEQHRFGVKQRERLSQKGDHPHIMVMSATPIPRTLAMIMYGDLHISIVDELPVGRLPIKNCVVNRDYREKAYQFILKEVQNGHQVYCICPMVEPGEQEQLENVEDYTASLREIMPPQIQIASLHGKMKPAEKNRIMTEFGNHNIDILVSTTVIEVGINVPNATVMLVENAERFGLAQLHQLRGRVGRGKDQSYCIFISGLTDQDTMDRLNILNHSNDGFEIAEKDLELRGPGDLFGIRQSGDIRFQLGDIYRDTDILKLASDEADHLMMEDPELSLKQHVLLREEITRRNLVDFKTI
ncbi:MAG: ATP-dependent DNA helicase RecG [Lachnospiraceae bacterium]|nr:ATP-dependent DNA helicase RecG [Lachnospiraceae bacterium]